jgi:hypothetical protein
MPVIVTEAGGRVYASRTNGSTTGTSSDQEVWETRLYVRKVQSRPQAPRCSSGADMVPSGSSKMSARFPLKNRKPQGGDRVDHGIALASTVDQFRFAQHGGLMTGRLDRNPGSFCQL